MYRSAFKFNLLPPKSEKEIVLEEERDDSVVYAMLLIFVSMFIYLLIVVLRGAVLEPQLVSNQNALDIANAQVASYATTQALYGELFIKTKTLKPVLAKKIDPADIFRVTTEITTKNPALVVTNYGREKSGKFVFQIVSPGFSYLSNLLKTVKAIEGVSNVYLRSTTLDETDAVVRSTLSLNINAS